MKKLIGKFILRKDNFYKAIKLTTNSLRSNFYSKNLHAQHLYSDKINNKFPGNNFYLINLSQAITSTTIIFASVFLFFS